MLPAETLLQLDHAYEDLHGEPKDYEDTTPLQLAALAAKVALDLPPSVDMGIWGPYGNRIQRLMQFTAEVRVNGAYVKRRLAGPTNFTGFRKAWRVLRTGLLKLKVAKSGPIDSYEEGVRVLSATFPEHWGTVLVTVLHNMEERWPQLRVRLEKRARQHGTMAAVDFNPAVPWESVLSCAAYGTGDDMAWWHTHLELPCLTGGPRGAMTRIAALEGDSEAHRAADKLERDCSSGSEDSPSQPKHTRGQSAFIKRKKLKSNMRAGNFKPSRGSNQRADGRYIKIGNKGICFAWNRSPDGCEDYPEGEERCGFRHVCEWCLKPHRACSDSCTSPNRPKGWKPSSSKGGKGTGKSKGWKRHS